MAPRHFHPFLACERHETVVRDARQDGRGPRREVFVALDADEVRCRTLVDLAVVLGIQKDTIHAQGVGSFGGAEGGSVVSSDLELTCTVGGRTIHITVDDKGRAVELPRVVGSNRRRDDHNLKI